MPCASIALDQTESEPGSIQAEVVSTMAICGSIITNLIGVTLAAFIGSAIVALLPAVISNGLKSYAATAIFGAALGNYASKAPKLGACSVAVAVICMLLKWTGAIPVWVLIILCVFGSIGIARLFYKTNKI